MSSDPSLPKPFKINIPEEEIARMRQLIASTRLPSKPFLPDVEWDYGIDLEWMKKMKEMWLEEFEWKEVEERMNRLRMFKVVVEGVELHFVNERSEREDAVPILLVHGWPGEYVTIHTSYLLLLPDFYVMELILMCFRCLGSFWEFHGIIEHLTNPPPDQPAFHVVIPSLPGFGFSSPPPKKLWTMSDNARILDHLMTGILGYPSYMAQGGDWGSIICTILGSTNFPACKLINLNMCSTPPPIKALLTLPLFLLPTSWRQYIYSWIYSEEELRDFSRTVGFMKNGMGYFVQQLTRPMSIGYALYDSPIGILAWIGEKYKEHIDPELLPHLTQDILTTLSLYYLTHTIHTAALPYRENQALYGRNMVITKPFGLSTFPYDIFVSPVSWVRAVHGEKLVFMKRHEKGGHFAALEVPELLAGDLREMVKENRALFDTER